MTDRDRLAADLHDELPINGDADAIADRLIALGWGKNMTADDAAYATGREDGLAEALDEERLARALEVAMSGKHVVPLGLRSEFGLPPIWEPLAAAIAKAYREDTEHE